MLALYPGRLAVLEGSLTRDELVVTYVGAKLYALLLQPMALLPRLLLHKLRLLLQSLALEPVLGELPRASDFGREAAPVHPNARRTIETPREATRADGLRSLPSWLSMCWDDVGTLVLGHGALSYLLSCGASVCLRPLAGRIHPRSSPLSLKGGAAGELHLR